SVAKDGNKQLSRNFKVREFSCKDGADKALVDDALYTALQKIRDHFGKAVTINSAYRTASHNSKVGGSPKSQHVQGKAADIRINGADPLLVAQYAESIGLGGIGLYDTFTHVDTRATKSKWDYRNGQKAVTSFGGQGQFKEKLNYYAEAQQRFSFDQRTMDYLFSYEYGEALLIKLATAK
ncbi:MAG: D-Ala-D-Ala carboxypeptidase family metallohydrolase, partial [Clostridiales bacterium]